MAGPILLSLATELALKALLCLERKKAPPRIHDLLKLFEQLEPDTQEMLEAMMRKVSAFPISAAVPSIQNLNPHLQEVFGVRMHPLRYILREHRDANMHWRFLHEQRWSLFETSEINHVLTVIISAYDKRWGDQQGGPRG